MWLFHILFTFLLSINVFSQNEKYIDVEKIRQQQEEIRKQQALDFVKNQEILQEEARKQRQAILDEQQKILNTQKEFQNELSDQKINHTFVPIDAIVLDAGHGGRDPGGVANGIEEKRLVFSILQKTHQLFRKKNKEIKIYVTRKDDSFISLQDRVEKTTRWSTKKNVLFVSIHANIAYNKRVEGLEIYTLSDKASDTDALATERLENAGFTQEDIQKTEAIYSILGDLIRDSTRKQSEWFAKYVYEDMLSSSQAFGRGLKRANFYVLKYNTVPSILLEIGYMSNLSEANRLKNASYQNQIAVGIYNGITRYINEYNKTEGFTK